MSAPSRPPQQAGPETQERPAPFEQHVAHNYDPLPVVIATGEGAWVTDSNGHRYLDALAGYSALNFGHRHPRLVAAAHEQLQRVTLTSRAFYNDQLGPFAAALAALTGFEAVLPMNTGAEAVETAIKLARRFSYRVKGVPQDTATIVVASNNFHGRTTTIVGFSSDDNARDDFGPFTPGFRIVPFGDMRALEAAIDATTAAVLLEPIQGEAGVILPPDGYLRHVRTLTADEQVLLIADEIQSGLGRTGTTFACDLEKVRPDVMLLGKALGGGIVPLSAVVADRAVMEVFTPGSHGSTFGGNPLACAIGRAVIELLQTGEYQQRAQDLGARLSSGLEDLARGSTRISQVRSIGLWAGIDLEGVSARRFCVELLHRGVLSNHAHERTVRLSPPLIITEAEIDLLLDRLAGTLGSV